MQKLRSIGFIAVGAIAGVLISLNFQAIAERATRTPLPIELSLSSTNMPSSPVVCACVPPQNSTDGPNCTTRTRSPYFSPAIVIAPVH